MNPRSVTFVGEIGPRVYGPCTRILALDGGGMRGIVPALILAEIEKRTGAPIAFQFDVIAGTSTGAILALGLSRPADSDAHQPAYSAEQLVGIYTRHAQAIFPNSFSVLRKLRWLFSPKYDPTNLESLLKDYFGDVSLEEALTDVLIPAYAIELRKRIWFSRFNGGRMLMRDVVRGAIAAPTYIPPVRLAVTNDIASAGYVSLVDGGLFANNPSLEALREAQGRRLDAQHRDESVLLLSLGTGADAKKYSFEQIWRWGAIDWINPLLNIAFDVQPNEEEVKILMPQGSTKKYVRLQVNLKGESLALDDSSEGAITDLTKQTQDLIARERDNLDFVVSLLALPRSPQCAGRYGVDREVPEGPRQPRGK